MRPLLLRSVALLILLCASPLPGTAQERVPEELLRVLRVADRGDDYLRLTLPDTSIEGRIRDLRGETVRLAGGETRLMQIRLVEERHKEGGGALYGALIGGIPMMLLLASFAGLCENDCDGVGLRLAVVGAALGGSVGGLVGAIVAPGVERWEALWPEP